MVMCPQENTAPLPSRPERLAQLNFLQSLQCIQQAMTESQGCESRDKFGDRMWEESQTLQMPQPSAFRGQESLPGTQSSH